MANPTNPLWPELDYKAWQDTCATLHLWTQVVGKIRLLQTPWLNHSWHVALYVNAKGLTTSLIPHGSRSFEIQFDFTQHVLDITVSDGSERRLALRPQSVADFYSEVMSALAALGLAVAISLGFVLGSVAILNRMSAPCVMLLGSSLFLPILIAVHAKSRQPCRFAVHFFFRKRDVFGQRGRVEIDLPFPLFQADDFYSTGTVRYFNRRRRVRTVAATKPRKRCAGWMLAPPITMTLRLALTLLSST